MQTTYTTAKETKRAMRVWIEGQKLNQAGFVPEARYTADYLSVAQTITLTLDPNGSRAVTKSNRNGKARPIIDLHSSEVSEVFSAGDRLRVTFKAGEIKIELHHEQQGKEERELTLKRNIASGKITEASMFTGGGVSTEAISEAIAHQGIETKLAWVAEMETKYIEAAGENCLCIDDDTTFLVGAVEEIEQHLFTSVDVLSFSMPCAGFSKAGKSKHKQTSEQHSGTALFGVMSAIKNSNPAIIISENVTEAWDSPIYQLLTSELRRTGYRIFEQILNQSHTGSIENRERYWMVAISEGVAPESLDLETFTGQRQQIIDILEEAPENAWCENDYLKEKEKRDLEAGKGFHRQLLTGQEDRCGTIGRFYAKKRSTEPFLTRADGKERLFTPAEHARVKSIPERLIQNVSTTTAHEILGQSVDYLQPFNLTKRIFAEILNAIRPASTLAA